MICDKGQKDPVLCIEVGQPQDMDAELVEAAITILIAMKWTGSAWCLWAFCIPAILE